MRLRMIFALLFVVIITSVFAIPRNIEYQGKLTGTDGVGVDDVLDMTFRIYDSQTGGTLLWTEVWSGVNAIDVNHGLFTVQLGTHETLDLYFDIPYFMEIEVDGSIMSPRVDFTSVPYAYRAAIADSVVGGGSSGGGGTLAEVLVAGNSTDNTPITDASDNIVDIDDNVIITASHVLYVDNISPEGTSSDINFGGALDMDGNYINNSDATYMEGDVAFNDDIVPVNSAQDIGKDAHPWDDVFLGASSMINLNGIAGTSGQVIKVDAGGNLVWGTDESSGSGTSEWNDAGIYKNVIDNDQVRAYETGATYGYQVTGSSTGSINIAGDFNTDWQVGSVTEKIAVNALAQSQSAQHAYGVKASARVYTGGGTGSDKYGVHGSAEYGANNYGIYGENLGTDGMQYAIYGDGGSGEYAGYFDGNVSITGTIEDSDGDVGTTGQVLSSTATGTDWITAGSGGTDTDWVISGTNLYPGVAGNVGIGSTSPTSKLHIIGDVRVSGHYLDSDGDVGTSGQILSSTTTGTNWIAAPTGGTDTDWTITGTNMYSTVSGNVGIGTTIPTTKLHVTGDTRITGRILDSSGDAGTTGQVLSSTATGTNWIAPTTGGTSPWEDAGTYARVVGNDKIRAYETAQAYAYRYVGAESGTVDYAGDFRTDWASGDAATKYGVYAIGDAYGSAAAYGVYAIGRNYSGGSSGGNKYGVYGTAEWGANNYGIYGTCTGTSGTQYAIYGDAASGEYAGYFDGNVSVTGALEDSDGDVGTTGQVLSSTATGTNWIAASGGSMTAGNDIDIAGTAINLEPTLNYVSDMNFDSFITDMARLKVGTSSPISAREFTDFGYPANEGIWLSVGSASDEGGIFITESGVIVQGDGDDDLMRIYDDDAAETKYSWTSYGGFLPGADNELTLGSATLTWENGYFTALTLGDSTITSWPGGGADNDWAYISGADLTGDVYHTGDVAIGTNATDSHTLNVEGYNSGAAAIRGAEQSGTSIYAEGMLGVLGYSGLPGTPYNIGVLGIKQAEGSDGAGVYALTLDDGPSNWGLYAAATGAGTNNYAVYATATGGANNYAGYFSGDVRVTARFLDSSGDAGTAGQVLTSTSTGTNWAAASSSTSYWGLSTTYTPNRIFNNDGYNLWLQSTTSDPNRRIYFGDGSYCWVGEDETDDRMTMHGSSLRIEHGSDGGTTGEALVSNGTTCTWQTVGGSGGITGSGTSGYIPRWTGSTTLANSSIRDNGSVAAVGSAVNTAYRLYVVDDPSSGVGYFYDDGGENVTLAESVWEGVDASSNSDDGVQGITTSSYYKGVYYSGGLGGSGDKSCIERTPEGPAALYCQESPESWFEDFGNNSISAGFSRVDIRSDFYNVIDISEESPLHVFITPNANIGNWWIEKDLQGFTVHAPDAPDGATFDWRMVAHRIHYTGTRMKIYEASYDDPYLYPENLGTYPRDVYEKLKGHEEDADHYDVYRTKSIAQFVPHEASPWNTNLPSDWKEQVANAKANVNITGQNEAIAQEAANAENAPELFFDVRGNVIPTEWVEQLKEANYPMLTYEEAQAKRLAGYLKEAKWMNEDPNEPKIKKDADGNPIK